VRFLKTQGGSTHSRGCPEKNEERVRFFSWMTSCELQAGTRIEKSLLVTRRTRVPSKRLQSATVTTLFSRLKAKRAMSAAALASLLLRRRSAQCGSAWQCVRSFSSSSTAPASNGALEAKVAEQLAEIQAAGTYKVERVITTPQAASIGAFLSLSSCVCVCVLSAAWNRGLALSARRRRRRRAYALSAGAADARQHLTLTPARTHART
jgi:hypothetical protein